MPDFSLPPNVSTPFEAAGRGRRLSGWIPSGQGPVKSVECNLQNLRNRARDSVRNDAIAAAAVRTWTVGLVGSGIVARTVGASPAQKSRIDALWRAWTPFAAADDCADFFGLQTIVARALIEAGEAFVVARPRLPIDGLPVPIQIQILEADMLPLYDRVLENGHCIVQGIEFDKTGRRVAYWFHKNHPGDGMINFETDLLRVEARLVSHIFAPGRPGQVRGVPTLSPILAKLRSVGNFDDAVLHRQELANLFCGFVRREPGTGDAAIDPLTGLPVQHGNDGSPIAGLEPGLMQELMPGESVDFSEPPDAGASYSEFMRTQAQAIAAGVGLPYELLTGDIRDVSDRTLRVSLNQWYRQIEALQWQILIPRFCAFVRKAWADAALLSGALTVAEAELARACEWSPPRFKYLHPVQDINALRAEVDAGFRSRSSVISEMGFDVADVDAERAADAAREVELDLQSEAQRIAEAEASKLEAEAEAAVQQSTAAKAAAAEARAAADRTRIETRSLEARAHLEDEAARNRVQSSALELEAAQLGLAELRSGWQPGNA